MDGELRRLIDEVKERTDLVALIGRDIELAEVSSVYKGRSPVHRDSDPSFVVWKESRSWCDFSGGGRVSGDCLDYVMWRRGVSFMEALQARRKANAIREEFLRELAAALDRDVLFVERPRLIAWLSSPGRVEHARLQP